MGAGGVGKSSITVQFVQGVYVDSYDPTIEDSYRKQIQVDGKICDLEILDTAGIAQFTAMRELYIKNGKGFLLVYSVTDENSLNELLSLREQVIKIKENSKIPMVLVGNKNDLTDKRVLSVEDGIKVSEQWNNVFFYETSALCRTNIDEVFINVVKQIMMNEKDLGDQKRETFEKIKNMNSMSNQNSETLSLFKKLKLCFLNFFKIKSNKNHGSNCITNDSNNCIKKKKDHNETMKSCNIV